MSDSAASVAPTKPLPPWRSSLARALHRNRSKPHSRYFQLATVHPDGRPANRTVVFRGFADFSSALMFVTDGRSHKVDDAAAHPWTEACWYFTQTREQFRLSGILTLVGPDHTADPGQPLRQAVWANLSDQSRRSFYGPHPGQQRTLTRPQEEAESPDPAHPPAVFYLGLLTPTSVDHLALRPTPQTRRRHGPGDGKDWSHVELNP